MGFAQGLFLYPNSSFIRDNVRDRPSSAARYWIRRWMLLAEFRREADKVWIETQTARDELCRTLRWPRSRVSVITNTQGSQYEHHQASRAQPSERDHREPYTLLYLAADYPHKNYALIAQLIPVLAKRGIPVRFMVTLPADAFERSFGGGHVDGESLVNLGPLDPDDCPASYESADAVFIPTLLEIFSAAYPEAMAMGRPILTSDMDFAREVCGNAAIYFDPQSPDSAADAIERLVSDPDLQRELVENGRRRLTEFDSAASRTEKLFDILGQMVPAGVEPSGSGMAPRAGDGHSDQDWRGWPVMVNGGWRSGYLDPTPTERFPRVDVERQLALTQTSGQHFVREPKLTMLVSYLRSLGPRRVWRKIKSRRAEAARNDTWLSVGMGKRCDTGQEVLFMSPSGPVAAGRLLVPMELTWPWPAHLQVPSAGHFVLRESKALTSSLSGDGARAVEDLAGWHPDEGTVPRLSKELLESLARLVVDPEPGVYDSLGSSPRSPVMERAAGESTGDRPAFTCFGYGQYAKTQIIPNLGKHLDLAAVHEIDPLQMGIIDSDSTVAWDTSPTLRAGEVVKNGVLAGFHHTHAPLAVDLIRRGARHVVIEKPVATDADQLASLLEAMKEHPGSKVHVAFQRRYSPFNVALKKDLGRGPISMSATVYEVPLPARHWYRWPVVGNEVVSNGCHWIDHFLFLNEFEAATELEVTTLRNQTVLGLELRNGATASISLRHEGSPRLGVLDLCTFWNGVATATIEDNSSYSSERGYAVLRRRKCHRYRSHELMYQEFSRRIVADAPGDSVRSVEVSAQTVLDLAASAGGR